MNFLAPWMLLGAAAVSVPIILHFFFRSRYRTVPWAAMKFLLTSIEQTSRRLRFQELLLLAMRCLILGLLAFAMARPISSAARGSGRGDAVDAVFLVDVSYSMGAADGATTRFDRAKTAALDVIDHLPPHSSVQIISIADRAELLGPRSPSNLDQARQLVKNLELTHLASDLTPGLAEAAGVLDRGQLPNKEVYLFSDLQKSGWEQQASNLVEHFRGIKDRAAVYVVRCGTRPLKNAAIVGITPQIGVPRPGERVSFAVLVRNTGSDAIRDEVRDLRIALSADGDKNSEETQVLPVVPVGETRAVTLSARFAKAGPRVLTARILQDDLDGDNRYDQIVPVRDSVNVLVINGGANEREPAKSSTFYLNHALAPVKELDRAKHYLQLREVSPRLASPALLAKTDLCFLVNVAMPDPDKAGDPLARQAVVPADFLAELNTWVRQGRGLVVFPGDNTRADHYNRVLGKKLGLLPANITKFHDLDGKRLLNLNRASFTLPAFAKFKEDRYFESFNDVKAWKVLELAEKTDAEVEGVVLRFDNKWPAMVRRKVDAGEVFLFASAAEPTASDLAISPPFIPLIQSLVAHLLHGQSDNHNVVAGQPVVWFPRDKEPLNYSLQTPEKKQVIRLGQAEKKDNRLVLKLPELTRAGVYRLLSRTVTQAEATGEVGIPIAVIPDLRESQDLQSLTEEQIDARLGFRPTHVVAGGEAAQTAGLDRFHREWTLWILMVVLLLAVGESALAWMCGRAW